MHGGAVTLARKFLTAGLKPDLLLATDMLDLTTFLALTKEKTASIPTAVYFHENQLTYPWSVEDRDVIHKRDKHYGFINYVSALSADAVFFNSRYHMQSFLSELLGFLKHFPDNQELDSIEYIRSKSSVLPLGLDLGLLDKYKQHIDSPEFLDRNPNSTIHNRKPLILWNHRWEYDKNPGDFFRALMILANRGLDFKIVVLGESFSQKPKEFLLARQKLGKRIVQFGYGKDFAEYAQWLWQADILPVTSNQDFFGASVVEALYCDCFPLLPKRLVYPELIPDELHSKYFYNDFNDLVNRLEKAIEDVDALKEHSLRWVAKELCWSIWAPKYDAQFQKILKMHRHGSH